jgi:hypothetical protein
MTCGLGVYVAMPLMWIAFEKCYPDNKAASTLQPPRGFRGRHKPAAVSSLLHQPDRHYCRPSKAFIMGLAWASTASRPWV